MDIIAYCADGDEFLVDVSVRNPLTSRYAPYACSKPGHAAGRGEYDKKKRYPISQGKTVIPCVAESFGRLGSTFLHFLDTVAAKVTSKDAQSTSPVRHLKGEWLTDLSAALAKAICRSTRAA